MGRITILVDGRPLQVPAGATVAAALLTAGISCRRSVEGAPRSALCGMGVCFECRVTIDGEPQRRSCLATCADGMRVSTGATHD